MVRYLKFVGCFVIVFLTSQIVGDVGQAGTWVAYHSGETGGEGSGLVLAYRDQQYLFPNSHPPEYCSSNAYGSICQSWSNNLVCSASPPYPNDHMGCSGGAQHICEDGTYLNADGICAKRPNVNSNGGDSGGCGGSAGSEGPIAGNPVVVATGEKIQTEVDWTSGGIHPLTFTRYYHSNAVGFFASNYSRLGPRWRSNFDARATYVQSSQVHIVLPDGKEYSFLLSGSVWQLMVPRFHPTTSNVVWWDQVRTDLDISLTVSPTSTDMRVEDGTHYIFDGAGYLKSIVFLDGYTQNLNYVGGVNTSVVDSFGRQLTFKYDSDFSKTGYLTALFTPDGKEFDYSYVNLVDPALAGTIVQQTDGNVSDSIPTGFWALNTVTYPDLTPTVTTDNPKRIYSYLGGSLFPFALTGITDERGIAYGVWTYDAQGRALTSEHVGGQDHFDFAYDDVNNKVTVTNPLGRQTIYSLTNYYFGAVTKITAVDGVATTNCVSSNTAYTYDANGFRNMTTDAEGRVKTWTKNSRGLPTTTVDGSGTASAKTTTTTWDATRPLPTQVNVAGLTTNMTYNSAGQVTQISQVDTTSTTVPYSTNGQTRTTNFGYTAFTAPVPPSVGPTGSILSDVPVTLVNPDAEIGNNSGWTLQNPTSGLNVVAGTPCVSAFCFQSAGSTTNSPALPMVTYQDVAIPSGNVAEVDAGQRAAKINWNQFNQFGRDESTVRLVFLSASGVQITSGQAQVLATQVWTPRSSTFPIPTGTRTIRIEMVVPGFYFYWQSFAYFDDLNLTLTSNGTASATPFLAVQNPDANSPVATGWTVSSGSVGTSQAYPCQWFSCFVDGSSGTDQFSQDVAITSDRYVEIDNGARAVELQWIDRTTSTTTKIVSRIDFLNASNTIIAGASVTSPPTSYIPGPTSTVSTWGLRTESVDVPVGARKVRLTFQFLHQGLGTPNTNVTDISAISLQLVRRALPVGPINLLTSVDGPLAGTGDTTTYSYDVNGNLSQVTNPVGLVTKILSVDAAGRPTSVQDENGINTSLAYDPLGRLTSTTVNPGASQALTSIIYDAVGDVTKITRPDNSSLTYTWDAAKRLTSVVNATNERIDYGYNVNGEMTSSSTKTAALVVTKQMTIVYDEIGRLLKSIGAAAQTTTLSYDRTDLNTQIKDPRNNLYGYAHDSLSRLVSETDQVSATVTYTRDGQDNIVAYQDPRAITTSYVRNGFGEVIQEVSPDGGTTIYLRDLRGLVTQRTDGRSVVENRTYDNAGRQLTATYPAATTENVTYAYDSVVSGNVGKGRLTSVTDQSGSTSFTYNALGQIITDKRVIATKTYTTSYLYSAAGRISQITYPSGRIVIYARNANGQVTGVTTKQTSGSTAVNVATAIAYAPMSNLVTSITHGNGLITTASYDQDYRLTALSLKNGSTVISSKTYAYGDGINLTGITDNVTATNTLAMGYSAANRLAWTTGPWGLEEHIYDAVGNRISDNLTVSGVATNRTQYYSNTSERLDNIWQNSALYRGYTYDGAGNIATDTRAGEAFVFTYNKRNRLASLTRNSTAYATYGYNALEQMVTRSTSAAGGPSGQVAYLYDLDGHLIAEATASTGATTRDYIWAADNDNVPQDLPLAVAEAATLYLVHTDHLGRPVRMTDSTKATVFQAIYKPFGEVYSTSGTKAMNLRFPGQYFLIETGFAYNWHRHYDPITGRYTQADPLRFVDGPSIYAYAGSSPLTNTDREGLGVGDADPNTSVQDYIAGNCVAKIRRVFPGQFLGGTIGDILAARAGGDRAADQAYKLLNDNRFQK